ncbi:MAG: hypothetical protein LQ340_007271 [Diploschistes diacapsis]|nr:MAG: hypothetical protein LQ340_007271 [Diploschistes diacapsis]
MAQDKEHQSSPPSSPLKNRSAAPSDASTRNHASSGAAGRLRSASTKILDFNVPLGVWSATGSVVSKAPSLTEIRRNSHGSRRDSTASLSRSGSMSPSSPEVHSSLTRTRPERTRTGSSVKLDKITGDDDDGFPANVFGRGELNDQSFVPGQRASQISTRVPKLGFRNSLASEQKLNNPVMEDAQSTPIADPSVLEYLRNEGPANYQKTDDSKEPFPNVGDDEELDDFFTKSKRSSKNIDGILGRTPERPPAAGPSALAEDRDSDSVNKEKVGTRGPRSGLDKDNDDLDDLVPRTKRSSKNIDAMLGRTPGKPATVNSEEPEDEPVKPAPDEQGVYPNGYSFPAEKTWWEAIVIGFKAFMRFTFTPLGFFIVLYGLLVVAWGGMLFLLLCNASPVMCQLGNGTYDCNNINSPRRVWIEWDSQIVNAFFCVTGFGLIPWRFRDFYYLLKWRVSKKEQGLRKLAGYHNGWFRLPNSDRLPVKSYSKSQMWEDENNPALPLPLSKTPAPPLTGARAPPTPLWKLDFVIWAFVWNTILQGVLSGFMWGLNRYNRPSWSTGLFVALACIVAGAGGIMQFTEGKKIKKWEGIPLSKGNTMEDAEGVQSERMHTERQEIVGESEEKGKVADGGETTKIS